MGKCKIFEYSRHRIRLLENESREIKLIIPGLRSLSIRDLLISYADYFQLLPLLRYETEFRITAALCPESNAALHPAFLVKLSGSNRLLCQNPAFIEIRDLNIAQDDIIILPGGGLQFIRKKISPCV